MSDGNNSNIAYYSLSPICGGGNDFNGRLGLHITAVFVILATSMFGIPLFLRTANSPVPGALFPLSAQKLPRLQIPNICFTFAKFFGSGVIIATAFIHLLASSFSELGDPCLSTFWNVNYPWSAAFSMISVFSLFLVELFAMRFAHVAFATTDPLGREEEQVTSPESFLPDHISPDLKGQADPTKIASDAQPEVMPIPSSSQHLDARLLGFFILEFGVIFHSVIIGLTLSTTGSDFNTLFVVIIFHQMFEGLGLGSRLAILPFKKGSIWPWILGSIYGFVTPLGMAIGLGVRTTYDSASQTALIVSGVLDAISSGILLYTGLVELLAHEFLFLRGASFMFPQLTML
jgi:solute carrier family 39 (zinc transporter), member 1/2/3